MHIIAMLLVTPCLDNKHAHTFYVPHALPYSIEVKATPSNTHAHNAGDVLISWNGVLHIIEPHIQ